MAGEDLDLASRDDLPLIADPTGVILPVLKPDGTPGAIAFNIIQSSVLQPPLFGSWTDLETFIGTTANQPAQVSGDPGNHIDPVTTVNPTPNSGAFAWSLAPAGWKFISPDSVANKADKTALAAEAAAREAEDAALESEISAIAAQDDAPFLPIAHGITATTGSIDQGGYGTGLVGDDGKLRFIPTGDHDGTLLEVLAGNIVAGICDQEGWSKHLWYADGTTSVGSVNYFGAEPGAYGSRNVMLKDSSNRSALLSLQDGDSYSLSLDEPGMARWVSGTSADVRSMALPAISANVAAGVTEIKQIIGMSQSLGVDFLGSPGLDLSPLDVGRGLMFSGGQIPGNRTDVTAVTPDTALSTLIDAVDGDVTCATRAIHALVGAEPSTAAVLYSAHGINGQPYSALKKGTQPYKNAIRAIMRGRLMAFLAGLSHSAPYMTWIQGENNYADVMATYLGHLVELQGDFQGDCNSITGRSDTIPVFLNQCASWTKYISAAKADGVPLAQLQASLNSPSLFICVGPKYQFPYADGVHLTNVGYRHMWEMIGAAMAAIAAGGTWKPLYPISATRSGNVVTVTYNVPVSPIVFDTANVTDPGGKGVVWADNGDGNSVSIASSAIVAPTQIAYALTATPTGTGGSLRHALDGTAGNNAGPTSGARCCIRDSSTLTSVDTTHLWNWCAASQVSVP